MSARLTASSAGPARAARAGVGTAAARTISARAVQVTRVLGRTVVGLTTLAVFVVAAVVAVPSLLGYQAYAITTGSMAGTADPGGIVVSEIVPVADLEVGDVITYLPPPEVGIGGPITHRIAEISRTEGTAEQLFRTKGDANPAADPWEFTLDESVQSRMVLHVPYLGMPVLWLADPTTRILAIGLPAAAVFVLSAVELVRALRERPAPAPAPAPVPAPAPAPAAAPVPAPAAAPSRS